MYKDKTFKQKFVDLQEWIPHLVDAVKKDLKNEHLKKDFQFIKKYLASKNVHKVSVEELAQAYERAVQEEEAGENLAEFISSRWLLKNSELYEFFEKSLTEIDPNFADIEELSAEQADTLIRASVNEFGAPRTYLFSVLNSVVFPEKHFVSLKKQAQTEKQQSAQKEEESEEKMTVENLRTSFAKEMDRLTDRYEKKLAGLQKKYIQDVESLKKQIAQLQRKLHDKASV